MSEETNEEIDLAILQEMMEDYGLSLNNTLEDLKHAIEQAIEDEPNE